MSSSISSFEAAPISVASPSAAVAFDVRFLARMGLAAGLISLALFFAAEWFVRAKVAPASPFYLQSQLFYGLEDVEGVLIGDSHTSQNVAGAPNLINFGLAGENVEQMRHKLTRLLDAHPEIERVVLQASPHMFADYRTTTHGRRDYSAIWSGEPVSYLLQDAYIRERIGWYVRRYLERGDLTLNGRFTAYGGLMSAHVMNTPLNDAQRDAIERRVEQQAVTRPLDDSVHFQMYREMLQMLAGRNIAVCMVEYPVTPHHRARVEERSANFADIRARLRRLAAYYGATYRSYWDAFDDYRFYRNGDHLNRHGAAQMTLMVLRDCGVSGG